MQWKLTLTLLGVSLFGTGLVPGGYLMGLATGLEPFHALLLGIGLGLSAGLAGTVVGFSIVRRVKLRIWDAGDMAGRIARGDFSARLRPNGDDEIGWLEEQLNQMTSQLQEAVADLRRSAEENRRLAEEAGRGAALEERTKLARDLHDTVNQNLFALAMRAAAVRRRLGMMGPESATLASDLQVVEEMAQEAHGQARQLILQLRPATLDQHGLGPALLEYIHRLAVKEGWELATHVEPVLGIKGPLAEHLFRVAQEALNNVSKHAQATRVELALRREDEILTLSVVDNGIGFDLRAGIRPIAVGLVGMRERIESLGGRLYVKSQIGSGTEIKVMVPVLVPEEVIPADSGLIG